MRAAAKLPGKGAVKQKDSPTGHTVCGGYFLFQNIAGDINAAGGSVRKRMGDAAAIANDVKAGMLVGFQFFIHLNLHIVELDLHAVQQRVVVGRAGGDLVEGVDHFDDAVENALRDDEREVAERGPLLAGVGKGQVFGS